MSRHTRRTFLKHAAAAAALAGSGIPARLAIADSKHKILGANDTIHLGVAGIHGRGSNHIDAFAAMKGVQVTHLIDPDSRTFGSRIKQVESRAHNTPKCYQDLRKALEDKDLDAISIASCNHWHSLLAIWACQAGKDVYVEKPCSHNVFEGRKLVEAARKFQCIVQHGTQSRSDNSWARKAALIASGKYGKLLVAKGYCCKPRWSIGFKETKEPPKELDYNIWLGPAPEQPYHENLVHYNWHWFWDTGNGDMGNQGVHQMDLARWGMGVTLPKSVISLGGRWVDAKDYKDQGQTPNMELCVFDFGGPLLVFETRGLVEGKKKNKEGKTEFPNKVDVEFYLEAGNIIGNQFFPKGQTKGEKLAEVEIKPRHDHFGNFIEAVRSRKQEDLNAEILEGHYSAALCHLGNISYRLGHEVPFSQKPEGFPDNPQVDESIETIKKNLVSALDVDLSKARYTLGPKLAFDATKEKFVDNPAADALLTRKYREPFVVPAEV